MMKALLPGNIITALSRFTWRERLQAVTLLANIYMLYWDWHDRFRDSLNFYPEHRIMVLGYFALLAFANLRILHRLIELPHTVHKKVPLWLVLYWSSVVGTNILALHMGPLTPNLPGYPPTALTKALWISYCPSLIILLS